MNNGVAAAAMTMSHKEVKSLRIPDKASIFTNWHSRHKKFVIFYDSLSCLVAIQNLQAESGYVMMFKNCTALVNTGKTNLLC